MFSYTICLYFTVSRSLCSFKEITDAAQQIDKIDSVYKNTTYIEGITYTAHGAQIPPPF